MKVIHTSAYMSKRKPMPSATEAIVPVWLNLDDLEVIERCLTDRMSTDELEPELQQNVARLARLFDWVRAEFLAHQS
jgi:hypothetical protein